MLFYSKRCNASMNLLRILENENLLCYFKLICVDDVLNKLPAAITAVPTMTVTNIAKPLVMQECFEWVNQIKFIRQQQITDINKKIIMQNNISNHGNHNNSNGNMQVDTRQPMFYDKEAMGGISDTFSYTNADEPLPQAYFGVGDEANNAIFTAPKEKHKISMGEQKRLLSDIETRRLDQDAEHSQLMKKKQIEAVYMAEQEKSSQQYR